MQDGSAECVRLLSSVTGSPSLLDEHREIRRVNWAQLCFITVSVSLFVDKSCRVEHLTTGHCAAELDLNTPSLSSELPPHDSFSLSLLVSGASSANCSPGKGAFVCLSRPVCGHLWVTSSS